MHVRHLASLQHIHLGLLVSIALAAPSWGSDPASIPRLPSGQHLSVLPHGYFEDPAPGTESLLDQDLQRAIAKGMSSASFEFDWDEIEPEPETYDLEWFENQLLEWKARGITRFYVNVSAISIGSVAGPPDLVDPSSPTGYVEGRHVDDPLIVGRFTKMLEQMIPVFLEHQGFALSVGNEVNVYLDENPDEAEHYVDFVGEVRDHVRTIAPDLPVGVILTRTAALADEPWHQPILNNSDFAGYNYYAGDELFQAIKSEARVRDEIQTLVAAARSKPILIQELGVNVGPRVGATPEEQAMVTAWMYDELLRHRPQVRWISWFKMTDFSQAFADAWGDLLLAAGEPPWIVDLFKASLRGQGLCSYDTGVCRPAFDRFLEAIDRNALSIDDLAWTDIETLQWSATSSADAFDVARGDLVQLVAAGGASDALARACAQVQSTHVDAEAPVGAGGFYYIVRARGLDLVGSWGAGTRDDDVGVCD